MKTITIIMMLLMVSLMGSSQKYYPAFYPKNTIAVVMMPYQSSKSFDLGVGLRYGRQLTNAFGVYGSTTFANHRLPLGGYIKDHWRTAIGIIYFTRPILSDESQFNVGAGLVYSTYGNKNITIHEWEDPDLWKPWSYEVKVSVRMFNRYFIKKNFNAGFGFDFVKNEGMVSFGYSF